MSKTGALNREQKAQEARVRRFVRSRGYVLSKDRSRDPASPEYGTYRIRHEMGGPWITGMTLRQAETYAMKPKPTLLDALETVKAALRTLKEGGFKLKPCDDRDLRNGCVGHISSTEQGLSVTASIVDCKCGGQHVAVWSDDGTVLFSDDPHQPFWKEKEDDLAANAA